VELTCFVETPQGSRNKYEYDEQAKTIKLDRRLFSSVVFPADYGFIEGAFTEDGRPIDALVLVTEPTFPGCRIDARPIGIFQMHSEEGIDDKVVCVPLHDPDWEKVHDLGDVPERQLDEVAHFFSIYKEFVPHGVTAIEGWAGREVAVRVIEDAQRRAGEQSRPEAPA